MQYLHPLQMVQLLGLSANKALSIKYTLYKPSPSQMTALARAATVPTSHRTTKTRIVATFCNGERICLQKQVNDGQRMAAMHRV